MKRFALLFLVLAACHPSLINVSPGSGRTFPAAAVPQSPDPDVIKLCRELQQETVGLVRDLAVETDPAVRKALIDARGKAEIGLDRCRDEGAL